jgi:predicted nucleic acid-binding protein
MKAVSNTTPLRYLIAIEQDDLLGQLFEKVFVPVAVYEELNRDEDAGNCAPPCVFTPCLA